MAEDYFNKLGKGTQPFRDAFKSKPAAPPKPVAAPKAPEASFKGVEAGKMYPGQSIEDWTHMEEAQKGISKRLAPKSVMGKSSSKR